MRLFRRNDRGQFLLGLSGRTDPRDAAVRHDKTTPADDAKRWEAVLSILIEADEGKDPSDWGPWSDFFILEPVD
jgi:hypothetical protein